jgi:ABC-type phosphate transport system auxiliary subunit
MIKYIKLETGVFAKYDTETKQAQVLVKAKLQKQIDFLQEQLNALPAPLTNAEKLAWFATHYDGTNYEQSRTAIKAQIAEIKAQIEEMIS